MESEIHSVIPMPWTSRRCSVSLTLNRSHPSSQLKLRERNWCIHFMLYNKDPTTKPGTLMNLLVCPAKLWLPGVRFLIRGSLVLLTNLLGFTQCSPEWKGFDFNFPLLTRWLDLELNWQLVVVFAIFLMTAATQMSETGGCWLILIGKNWQPFVFRHKLQIIISQSLTRLSSNT